MNSLAYLGIALVIAVVGGIVVAIALREPSSKRGDGVDQFRRRMSALAPEDDAVVVADNTKTLRPDTPDEAAAPVGAAPTPEPPYDPPVKPIPRPETSDGSAASSAPPMLAMPIPEPIPTPDSASQPEPAPQHVDAASALGDSATTEPAQPAAVEPAAVDAAAAASPEPAVSPETDVVAADDAREND